MRAVVQRVRAASVEVGGERVGAIERGVALLVGVGAGDRAEDAERLARKVAELRIFDDERGRMGRALADVGGAVLAVPQFTLYADVRRGRRPDLGGGAPPDAGSRLFDLFCGALRAAGLAVETGRFGASMLVRLEGEGPVTIVLSTDGWDEAKV